MGMQKQSDAASIRWAWHGTKAENIKSIASKNFKSSFCKRQVHGKGHYFSPDPHLALRYAPDTYGQDGNAYKCLVLCQTLLGNTAASKSPNGDSNTHKDFCYVIPDERQIWPVYVVVVRVGGPRRVRTNPQKTHNIVPNHIQNQALRTQAIQASHAKNKALMQALQANTKALQAKIQALQANTTSAIKALSSSHLQHAHIPFNHMNQPIHQNQHAFTKRIHPGPRPTNRNPRSNRRNGLRNGRENKI